MSSVEYRGLQIKRVPKPKSSETDENVYWKGYRHIIEDKLSNAISHICFSVIRPYHYVVTAGTNVALYNGETRQRIKIFSRFHDIAYSGNLRRDGRLLVASDEGGNVKLFDIDKKTMLRQSKVHSAACHSVDFVTNTQTVSAGDDHNTCLFDIPSDSVVSVFSGHSDYVRSLDSHIGTSESVTILTGSYDHSVRLWDTRLSPTHANVMTSRFDHPVNSVVRVSESVALVAVDKDIAVVDIPNGGRIMSMISAHQKAVTCLSFQDDRSRGCVRILSSSLDSSVKVIDPVSFSVVHSFKFQDPVLSVAASCGGTLACGSLNGALSTRIHTVTKALQSQSLNALSNSLPQGTAPGTLALPTAPVATKRQLTEDKHMVNVHVDRRKRLAKWDNRLRKFEFKRALDGVLATRNVVTIISMLEELRDRRCLTTAIHGRSDKELEPLVSFINFYISDPVYTDILSMVTDIIINTYAGEIGNSPCVDAQLLKLRDSVIRECELKRDVLNVTGLLDSMMANSK